MSLCDLHKQTNSILLLSTRRFLAETLNEYEFLCCNCLPFWWFITFFFFIGCSDYLLCVLCEWRPELVWKVWAAVALGDWDIEEARTVRAHTVLKRDLISRVIKITGVGVNHGCAGPYMISVQTTQRGLLKTVPQYVLNKNVTILTVSDDAPDKFASWCFGKTHLKK